MKVKKIPMRTCVVTHEKYPKQELVRIVKTKENEVKVDLTSKMNGRGAYLKKDLAVILEAKEKKILDRTLDIVVPDHIYQELESLVK